MKQIKLYERSYDFDEAVRKRKYLYKPCHGRMTFLKFVKVNEKMGIFARVGYNDDIFHISKIANNFLDKIKDNPNNIYTTNEILAAEFITLSYEPKDDCTYLAEATNNNHIIIYNKINDKNELEIKYVIIHELLHIIQYVRSRNAKNDSFFIRLRAYLRRPDVDVNDLEENTRYFLYLLYREELFEIYAWSNDAYIMAYEYKRNYPEKHDNEIMKYVMQMLSMTTTKLNNAIISIKTDDISYNAILSILFSLFSEIGGNSGQSYFDKTVFELPIIQQLRFIISRILKKYNKETDIAKYILKLKETYKDLLLEVKDIITNSFIEHLKYWHKHACVKLGKAIQLGIEDATI